MGIFISHAKADQVLVDKFVDLLQTGLNVSQSEIFCTSLEGMGIPRGKTFVEFIRGNMAGADFVVMLLTHSYYESAFCLCELGATWITGADAFPILVPPLGYDDLKAVLTGVQSGSIDDKNVLNELRDRLTAAKLATAATGRWESKRDEFISGFARVQKKLPGRTLVRASELEAARKMYDAAQNSLDEKNSKIEKLQETIEELRKCKDKEQVRRVMAASGNVDKQFKEVIGRCVGAIEKLPSVVREAMFYKVREEQWYPDTYLNRDQWRDIEEAEQRGLLDKAENNRVSLNDHPKVSKALAVIDELREFMSEHADTDFAELFVDEYEYPFDLMNRDFWEDNLGL